MPTPQQRWNAANREKVHEYERRDRLKRRFGISAEQYDEMLRRQKGVCAICRQPETKMRKGKPLRLAVDHCHLTGAVRGLLCHDCNTGIAKLEEDPGNLRRAANYIERSRR